MNRYTPQQYDTVLNKLPQEIRDVVLSNNTTEHLWKIGEKHNLHIDQVGMMHDIAMDTMMGIISTKNFVKELSDELHISILDASVVARDIDENVFKPVKETMVSLYAGGAPHKPSSSLVQFYEDEEEHENLNRNILLKEIESPAAPIVKRETNMIASKVVSLLGSEEKKVELVDKSKNLEEVKKPTEITEYHQEIQQGGKVVSELGSEEYKQPVSKLVSLEDSKVNFNSNQLTNSPTNKLGSMDFLNKITSLKLSKTFVMPKNGGVEVVDELVKETSAKNNMAETIKIINELDNKTTNPPLLEKTPNATPVFKPETLQTPKIDPYREQI